MSRHLNIRTPHFHLSARRRHRNGIVIERGPAGALAVGALAFGAFAIGALAVGALTINRLAVKRARFERPSIRTLEVDRTIVRERSGSADSL
jgi:hypothetical protein